MKHFISVLDATKSEFIELLALAEDAKLNPKKYSGSLDHKTLTMLFEKQSTRTRLSFEIAMTQLGGHAVYFNPDDTHFKKEDLKDTSKMFSIYSDILCARVYSHSMLVEFARHSSIPVINALSDIEHPTQALADLLTIKECRGLQKTKVAFIGDGNNVCNSLMLACAYAGIDFAVACPKGYEPDPELLKKSILSGGKIKLTNNPVEVAKGADVIYTDVWVSMGHEDESKNRQAAFSNYAISKSLMDITNDAIFMHCLPTIRGREVSADVIDGASSVVYNQAENKLHAEKAVLLKLGMGMIPDEC